MKKVKEVSSNRRILQEYTHSSGFRHIHIPYAYGDISGCIIVNTPSQSDAGLQHLVEHFVYLGAESYPGHDLYELLNGKFMSTHVNATTSLRHTMYDYSSPSQESFNQLTDVHMDMLLKPIFDPYICSKEQYVVFNEMLGRMANGAMYQLLTALAAKAYGADCPLAHMLGGYPELIANVSLEELRQFHTNHYYPGNMTLLTVGALDLHALHSILDAKLEGYNYTPATTTHFEIKKETAYQESPAVVAYTVTPDVYGYAAYYPFEQFTAQQWSQAELLSDIFMHSSISYSAWRDFTLDCDLSLKASVQLIECGYLGIPGLLIHLEALNSNSPMAQHWTEYLQYLVSLDNTTWQEVLEYRKQRILNIMYLMDTTSDATSIIIERLKERILAYDDVLERYQPEHFTNLLALCDNPESVKTLIKEWLLDISPVALNMTSEPNVKQILSEVATEYGPMLLEKMAREAEYAIDTPIAEVAVQWPQAELHVSAPTPTKVVKGPVDMCIYPVDNDKVSVLTMMFPIKNLSSKYLMSANLVSELMEDLEFKNLPVDLNAFYILRKSVSVTTLFNTAGESEVAMECHFHYLTEHAIEMLDIVKTWLFELDLTKQKELIRGALMEYTSAVANSTTFSWSPALVLQAQQPFLEGIGPRLALETNYYIEFIPQAMKRPAFQTWQSVYESLFNSDVKIAHATNLNSEALETFNTKLFSIFNKKIVKKTVAFDSDYKVSDYEELTTSNAMAAALAIPDWKDPDHWKFAILGQYLDILIAREFRVEQGAYTAILECSPVGSYVISIIDTPNNALALRRLLEIDWLSESVDLGAWESAKLQYLKNKLRSNNIFEACLQEWDILNGWLTQGSELPTSLENIVQLNALEVMKLARERLVIKNRLPWNIQIIGQVDVSMLEYEEVAL